MALPPLAAIRVFEAAGRLEHFSRAAEELGMTQAAVSYQVRLLEERLGTRLFIRAHGRVVLTPVGRLLLGPVSSAFRELANAFDTLVAGEEAVLTISASQSFATAWLAPRLGAFQLRFPDIAVRLSSSNELISFGDGRFDAALRIGPGGWDGLQQDFLFRSHAAPICSPEFVRRHQLTDPAQLVALERLAPDEHWWSDWFGEIGVTAPPPGGNRGMVLDNQAMEANAVLGGFGIAMMTPMFWARQLEDGSLVRPFDHIHVSRRSSHWLVYPAGPGARRRKLVRFREWLCEEIATARATLPAAVFEAPADAT